MPVDRWCCILVSIDNECMEVDDNLSYGIYVNHQPVLITVVIPICRDSATDNE